MSKIGNLNMDLQDIIDEMGIDATPASLTEDEREAVKSNLNETIRTNSCEVNCPHKLMLGLL